VRNWKRQKEILNLKKDKKELLKKLTEELKTLTSKEGYMLNGKNAVQLKEKAQA